MKNRFWGALSLSLLLLGASISQTWASPNGPLPKNIEDAAQAFQKEYSDQGIIGLSKSLPNCYQAARTVKRLEAVEYCMMMDLMAYHTHQLAQKATGIAMSVPYVEAEQTDKRLRGMLQETGVVDPEAQTRYLTTLSQTAFDKASQSKP